MAVGGSFRYTVWDPWMILSQMATLQCYFYAALGAWVFAWDVLTGEYPRSLDQVFKYSSLMLNQPHGKILVAAYLCNAISCSLALWYVVQRTKLCLDFTCTVYFFHVIACWIYNGHLAPTFSWWVLNGVSVTVMCVTGEFLCMRTELKAIPVSMAATANSAKVDL